MLLSSILRFTEVCFLVVLIFLKHQIFFSGFVGNESSDLLVSKKCSFVITIDYSTASSRKMSNMLDVLLLNVSND